VLAGLQRLHRDRDVQVVGQRVVDRLDLGIGQQRLVGAIGLRDAELLGRRLGPRLVARRDAGDDDALGLQHGRDDFLHADLGRADDAPDHRFHVLFPR
jgi:hypothetical protein